MGSQKGDPRVFLFLQHMYVLLASCFLYLDTKCCTYGELNSAHLEGKRNCKTVAESNILQGSEANTMITS